MKCPICNSEYEKLISLSIHYRKSHNGTAKQLRIDLFHDGKEPTCACGCGETTKFLTLMKGYSTYILGHSSKVNNNWGHNKIAQEKSLKKRRDEGLWSRDPWNRGKTKENDPEFATIAEKAYNSEKEKIRKSSQMKNQWANEQLQPLTGSAHPQWKGGTSELSAMCRSRLYREWSFPKMVTANFKCVQCGSSDELEVHHDVERFSSILHKGIKVLGEPGNDFDRKSCFVDWVMWYHKTNDISGKVLCSICHKREHNNS